MGKLWQRDGFCSVLWRWIGFVWVLSFTGDCSIVEHLDSDHFISCSHELCPRLHYLCFHPGTFFLSDTAFGRVWHCLLLVRERELCLITTVVMIDPIPSYDISPTGLTYLIVGGTRWILWGIFSFQSQRGSPVANHYPLKSIRKEWIKPSCNYSISLGQVLQVGRQYVVVNSLTGSW